MLHGVTKINRSILRITTSFVDAYIDTMPLHPRNTNLALFFNYYYYVQHNLNDL
jgi:hypothetical protein